MPTAELVIANAAFHTQDPSGLPHGALAVANGQILAMAPDASDLREVISPSTRLIDATGYTVTPGLIDSHIHISWATTLARGLDLGGVTSWEPFLTALRAEAKRLRAQGDTEQWLLARNLEYRVFAGRDFDGSAISEAVLGLPAAIMFVDLHTVLATPEALAAAGIVGPEKFTDNARIMVRPDGTLTGELREPSAYNRLLDHAPQLTPAQTQAHIIETLASLNRSGVTGGVTMEGYRHTLDLFEELDTTGSGLTVRLRTALQHNQNMTEDHIVDIISQRDRGGKRWRAGMIKMFHDGVIDTGTSWLYEADNFGDGVTPFWSHPEDYKKLVVRYAEAGFQIATHAIGDRAVGETVAVYEHVGAHSTFGAPHRIEHLEIMTNADLARIAALGIAVSMQPLHMQWRLPDGSDSWTERISPERSALAWRTSDVLASGIPLVLGSDWPVAEYDARLGMAWSQLRRIPGQRDSHVYEPLQRLSAEAALTAYTRTAGQVMGMPKAGVIAEGNYADLAIWSQDPVAVPADELVDIPIAATIVDGQVVHDAL